MIGLMRTVLVNLGLTLFVLSLCLLAAEGALAWLGFSSLYKSGISALHDPILGYRLPPRYAVGIDEQGYRNPTSEGPFEVVVVSPTNLPVTVL